ncbi:hypothetical protein ACW2Q0_12910 [Nocardia sp. R16R-3T]
MAARDAGARRYLDDLEIERIGAEPPRSFRIPRWREGDDLGIG